MADRNGSSAHDTGGNGNGAFGGAGAARPAASPVNGAGGSGGAAIAVDWERLARASAHPLRVSILEVLGLDGGRVLSPIDLSRELQLPLSNTNYHVRELAKAGLIELAGQRPVRGATEHFYRLPSGAGRPAPSGRPALPTG